MKGEPTISVVIATYNCEKTIALAIKSVLEQDYKALELIIIDGNSTDRTLEIINSFSDSRIRCLSEPDKGIYDAWNKGVILSKSERIIFIGSDDTFAQTTSLSTFWSNVKPKNFNNPVIYGDLIAQDINGGHIARIGAEWKNPWRFPANVLRSSFPIPIMAAFFDRTTIIQHGLFDSNLKIMSDINLVLKIAKKIEPIYIPDCLVTLMGFGGISTNPESGRIAISEAYRVRKQNNLYTLLNLEFVARCIQHFIKYLISKYLGKKAEKLMTSSLHKLKSLIYKMR